MKCRVVVCLLFVLLLVALVGCKPTNKYVVHFVVDDQTIAVRVVNGKVEVPQDPQKDGFDFVGWFFIQDGQEVSFSEAFPDGEVGKRNLEVYAKWDAQIVHHITFIADGDEVLTIMDVRNGEVLESTPLPVRVGYDFVAWCVTPQGTVLFDETQPIGYSQTLYAKWLPIGETPKENYTVTTYGVTTEQAVYQIEEGETVQPEDPVWVGYRFDGWYVDEDLTMAYDTSLAVTHSFSLYPQWVEVPERIIVSFDTDGGSDVASFSVKYNALLIKPSNPIKDKHTFLGWYDATGVEFDFATRRIKEETVIYARWQPIPEVLYTVTFVKNNGEADETLSFVDSLPVLIYPTKQGCQFAGWYVNTALTIPYESLERVPTVLTLYAKWSEESILDGMLFVANTNGDGYILQEYQGENTQVSIPSQVNGMPVVEIAANAFARSSIQSVQIPACVESIDSFAFYQCGSLSQVTFVGESRLTDLGGSAFVGTAIRQIRLGANVETIGDSAFAETPLVNVVVDGAAVLGEKVFYRCTSLSYLSMRNVVSLGVYTAYGCRSLKDLFLDNCTTIASNSFGGCSSLGTVSLPRCEAIRPSAFENCINLISFECPVVRYLGTKALYNCAKLRSLSLVCVQELGQEALGYCLSLSRVAFGAALITIGENCFDHCVSIMFAFDEPNELFHTVDGSLLKGSTLMAAGGLTNEYTIPFGVVKADISAFANCSNVLTLHISASVEDLGLLAAVNLTSLRIIEVDASNTAYRVDEAGYLYKGNQLVKYIDQIDCTEWTMASGISIGVGAFAGCQYLTTVTLADDYKVIEVGAFYLCYSLTTLLNTDAVTRIQSAAFWGCDRFIQPEWASGIVIDEYAFGE